MMRDPLVWQAIAAVLAAYAATIGGIYAVVTKPLILSQTSIQSQLTDIVTRLGRIEAKLDNHETRITRLEERTSPLRH
jgi:hypothetical protein